MSKKEVQAKPVEKVKEEDVLEEAVKPIEENTDEPEMPLTKRIADLIVTEEDVLKPVKLNTENINDGTEYQKGIAYIAYPYFYQYRGTTMTVEYDHKEPGIYLTPDDHYIWVPVTEGNGDDDARYRVDDKFATADERKIIDIMIDRDDIQLAIPDSGRVFRPEETPNDDILKRLIKRILRTKNVDIDAYKYRFADKNALFNFKQVIKGDGKLSMLLFERGCNALNLRYTITIEENDPEHPIGDALKKPLVICSEDGYDV